MWPHLSDNRVVACPSRGLLGLSNRESFREAVRVSIPGLMVKSMENVSPLVGFSDVAGLECDGCGLEDLGDEGSAQSSGRAESRSPSVLCILHVF